MGIESDQLVYDYLSRVGDAAQQQQLESGDRMRLVSTLRNEIDRQRGKFGSDSPAAVRRILGRLGEPDALVRAASARGTGAAPPPVLPEPAVPEQRARRLRKAVIPEQASAPPSGALSGAAPYPAATDGPGPVGAQAPGREPDWWRIESGPMGVAPTGVPGFVGGVEIPDILKPPPKDPEDEAEGETEGEAGSESGEAVEKGAEEDEGRRRFRLRLPRRGAGKQSGARGLSNPFLLLAAALLVVGAFLGSWIALGGGWLLAYASRTLSRAEAKWAVFGLPSVSAAGGLVWLWGRLDGRWGDPIPDDAMAEALSGTWPVVVRTAAVTSALYLIWRSRRK
ncbi:hypothetical protein ACFVWZ_08385 [Streptomyces sp. NPDC058200]|uniref:hypothetical protein n=1 Tax=Streptomyces sp. NPDC058200 TaxID=3346378 RepID=UPI0036E9A2D0